METFKKLLELSGWILLVVGAASLAAMFLSMIWRLTYVIWAGA